MDARFIRRYENFKKSLDAMSEARTRDPEDSFVLSGTGAKFSITFELAWKVMKDILIQYYAISDFVTGSPRDTLKNAYQAKLIHDESWLDMLECRNLLTHDYDGDIIREQYHKITGQYLEAFYKLTETVDALLAGLEHNEKKNY